MSCPLAANDRHRGRREGGNIISFSGQIVAELLQGNSSAFRFSVPTGACYTQVVSEPLPPLVAIVDDEEHLRETVSRALRAEGYRTAVYPDGADAWESFSAAMPDLVILDIIMPRMDGLELCRRLRAASDSVPVMFLTSRDEEFDRVLGLELGADDYLCKPFSLRELAARVKVLFRRAARRFGERAP
jgi:CheY-like chemotaxis protein